MLKKDATIQDIKEEVLFQVARLSFAGTLEEEKDALPYAMIPGPQANFRCCIYREREVIRQRIRLAQNKPGSGTSARNLIQVVEAACADCPISPYVVTDNCQKCMGKFCQQACHFGAISMGSERAHIDPSKCKECGKCSQACPYNAIAALTRPCKRSCPVNAISMQPETGIVSIDDEKCIQCGACIKSCPFGAIDSLSSLSEVIREIQSPRPVIAMVAPSLEGQFGPGITMAAVRKGFMDAGFSDMVEVSIGGDMTAASEADEWAEAYAAGEKKTTSCCPAFVNMIEKHFPTLTGHMSTTVSPMCGVSRCLKSQSPDVVTVFVGPCIAKKSEVRDFGITGNADYALTIEEAMAILKAREVTIAPLGDPMQQGSIYGKRFGNGGGVTAAVLQCMKESGLSIEPQVMTCSGGAECKKALTLLKVGRLPADFIEGMACPGGCVGGPAGLKSENAAKKDRDTLLSAADGRGVHENLSHYPMDRFSMHR